MDRTKREGKLETTSPKSLVFWFGTVLAESDVVAVHAHAVVAVHAVTPVVVAVVLVWLERRSSVSIRASIQ